MLRWIRIALTLFVSSGLCATVLNASGRDGTLPPCALSVNAIAPDSLVIIWWNVENAFDTLDDPSTKDDDFTPQGRLQWTSKRYYRKVAQIAKGIRTAVGPGAPDFIGLCEIESPAVMEDIVRRLPWEWSLWQYYEEGPDTRGIDIVVLYQGERWELVQANLTFNAIVNGSRAAITTVFAQRHAPWDTISLSWWHLPSRRRSNPAFRQGSLHQFCQNTASDFILGDMNSDPRGPLAGWMETFAYHHVPFCGNWGTFAFGQKWSHLDSVWKVASSSWKGNYRAIRFNSPSDEIRLPSLKPTFYAGKYYGGASDHLPLRFIVHK